MSKLTPEVLQQLLDEDEYGLLTPETKPEPVTNADILANRFDEINEFIDQHERNPDPANVDDIGEFQLGHRLQAILDNPEYRASLSHLDRHGLFDQSAAAEPDSIDDLLASDDPLLDGLLTPGSSAADGLFTNKYIPPPAKVSPDKVARGKPCEDFDQFEQLFVGCHADLRSGRRKLVQFSGPSNIKAGFFYVQRGMLAYVAEIGELVKKPKGMDGRLRCIYENGTESDLLLHSLARSVSEDGKMVTEPIDTYVETFETPEHMRTGHVYVVKTLSTDHKLALFQNLHKIGYTTNSPESRVAGAANDATFLEAPALLIASFEMPAEYAKLMETVLHQFFSAVRLDVWFDDGPSANEWFDVPLAAIEEAVDLVQTGQLSNYEYDPKSHQAKLASGNYKRVRKQ